MRAPRASGRSPPPAPGDRPHRTRLDCTQTGARITGPSLTSVDRPDDRLDRNRRAAHRAHRLGAQPRDAAAHVPAHRDGRAASCSRPTVAALIWVERRPVPTTRVWQRRSRSGSAAPGFRRPALLGQRGLDDLLLLRRRARGAAGVRHGRAARAAAARAPARGRARRDGRPGRDLPAFNAGAAPAHGWGAAMSTDTAFALGMLALVGRRFPAAARVHAHGRRRRRPRRARRDRDRLQRAGRRSSPLLVGLGADRRRRWCVRCAGVRNGLVYSRARRRGLGGAV